MVKLVMCILGVAVAHPIRSALFEPGSSTLFDPHRTLLSYHRSRHQQTVSTSPRVPPCVAENSCQCPPRFNPKAGPEANLKIGFGEQPVYAEQAFRPLESIAYYYLGHVFNQQADVGELLGAYSQMQNFSQNSTSWGDELVRLGEQVEAFGRASEGEGDTLGAASAYLRASTYFRAPMHRSMPPNSQDPFRGRGGWAKYTRKNVALFREYLRLARPEAEPVAFAYGKTALPGYWFDAHSFAASAETRTELLPAMVVFPGRDSKKEDLLFMCDNALRRRYHCLLFDGPGQGEARVLQGLTFTPRWEAVVAAAIEYVSHRPGVDAGRIGLFGNSMGGFLALRAAAHEPRLSATISDPAAQDFFTQSVLAPMAAALCAEFQRAADARGGGWGAAGNLNAWLADFAAENATAFDEAVLPAYASSSEMRLNLDYLAYVFGAPSMHESIRDHGHVNGSLAALVFGEIARYRLSDQEVESIATPQLLAGSSPDDDFMANASGVFNKLCPAMAPSPECPSQRSLTCSAPRAGTSGPVTQHCFRRDTMAYGHSQPAALGRAAEVFYGWLRNVWQ